MGRTLPRSVPLLGATLSGHKTWRRYLLVTLVWLIVFPFAAFSALLVHELAHCAVGVILGLKPASIRVGLREFCFVQRDVVSNPRFSFARLFSGWVIFAPEGVTRWKWASMSLAGPLASLIALIALLSAGKVGMGLAGPAEAEAYFEVFRLQFALLSGVLFVSNIYPNRDAFSPNDCFHAWSAIKGGETWARWEACLFLLFQHWCGIRPSQWPLSALSRLLHPNDRSPTALRAHVLRIYALGDRRDCNAVNESVAFAAPLASSHGFPELLAEFAFWECVAGCDPEVAAGNLRRAEEHVRYSGHPSIIKARAVLTKSLDPNQESLIGSAMRIVEREIADYGGGIAVAEREWLLSRRSR